MDLDIDTTTPRQPEPPSERQSRKGRRSRPTAIDQDIDTSQETRPADVPQPAKSSWNAEEPRRKSRKSIDYDERKATVVGGNSEEAMVVIPDLMYCCLTRDETEEEIQTTIATAPVIRHLNQSITDLENEMAESETMLSQMNANSIPGIDLSRLIQLALCPVDQLQEDDQHWDWDVVFNEIASINI